MWHVDDSDYKQAYLAAVQNAGVTTPNLLQMLSVPQV